MTYIDWLHRFDYEYSVFDSNIQFFQESTDKSSFKKKMWHSLKKHIGLLTNIVADYNVILQLSKLSLRQTNNLSTSYVEYAKNLKLVTVCSGLSKHFTNSQIKDGIVGEDAYFISSQQGKCDVIGVADGVGGWSSIGIDPSIFSFNLMKQCKRIVEKDELNIYKNNNPVSVKAPMQILEKAYKTMVESKDDKLIGSATACILLFDYASHNLFSANLGDSGFVVIRDNKIIHRSVEQQHYFNCPYQLAIYPLNMSRNIQTDGAESAIKNSFKLIEGDLICLATDGLWDNLNDDMLLKMLKNKFENSNDIQLAADNIVEHTVKLSLDAQYLSPFAIAAKQHQRDYEGGKPDDITVLLARVTYSD